MRKRYIALKLNNPPFPSKKALLTILRKNVALTQSGECLEQYNIQIIEYDSNTGYGIIRCEHRTVPALRSSTKNFGEYNIETIKTSGSIKGLRRKFLSKTVQ